jgi:hypothetical protein
MRRYLAVGAVLGAIASLTAAQSSAVSTCLRSFPTSCSFPALQFTSGALISPRMLPRNEYVPVTASLFGSVKTGDGTHPSALRELLLDVDKDVKINAKGYPVCEGVGGRKIRGDPKELARACRSSILGNGSAHFEIAFPEQEPIVVASPITVFNGGEKGGEITLYIHAFITVPAPRTAVTTVTISRKGSGLRSISKIPVTAGGSGSLLDFKFRMGKTYIYKGKKVGYFEAKCPDGKFKANVEKVLFKNEANTPGVAATTVLKGGLVVPCTPRD